MGDMKSFFPGRKGNNFPRYRTNNMSSGQYRQRVKAVAEQPERQPSGRRDSTPRFARITTDVLPIFKAAGSGLYAQKLVPARHVEIVSIPAQNTHSGIGGHSPKRERSCPIGITRKCWKSHTLSTRFDSQKRSDCQRIHPGTLKTLDRFLR